LRDLGDERFTKRELAEKRLESMGESATSMLRQFEKLTANAEAKKRATALLRLVEPSAPPRLRERRAVEILEQLDCDEARSLLEKLAKGLSSASLTKDAMDALERCRHGQSNR